MRTLAFSVLRLLGVSIFGNTDFDLPFLAQNLRLTVRFF
jgi:hypothetical protein